MLTPRDFTLPHARVMPLISKTHEPPQTKGSFKAPALHLLPHIKGGRRESQSEVLEMFKLRTRGNQTMNNTCPAQRTGTGSTRTRRSYANT